MYSLNNKSIYKFINSPYKLIKCYKEMSICQKTQQTELT